MKVWEATRTASAHRRDTVQTQWLHFARSLFAGQAPSSISPPGRPWADFTPFCLLLSIKSEQNRTSGHGVGWLAIALPHPISLSQPQSSGAAGTNVLGQHLVKPGKKLPGRSCGECLASPTPRGHSRGNTLAMSIAHLPAAQLGLSLNLLPTQGLRRGRLPKRHLLGQAPLQVLQLLADLPYEATIFILIRGLPGQQTLLILVVATDEGCLAHVHQTVAGEEG